MAVQVSPENVVGRDRLIDQIWRQIQKRSIRFTAERRIGKTTVMRKMLANPRPGVTPLYLDLERIDSPQRFTEVLLTEMKPLLSGKQKAAEWFGTFLGGVGGTEIGGIVKLPERGQSDWQPTLEKAFDGICANHSDTTLLLLFDELPYMLQKIAAREKRVGSPDHAALEMLDTLRAMRDKHANLRMIFAGSVGLHHVLDDLRKQEFASQPVNDMPAVEIQALAQADAILLAERLIESEQVQATEADRDLLPERLATLTDRVPFYLERVIARLSEQPGPVSIIDAEQVVRRHLTDDNDAWEMEHFRTRIPIYYIGTSKDANDKPIEVAKVASTILDVLAVAPEPQTIDQIWAAVKATLALDNRDQVIRLLKSLALDHYLTSDTQKRYSFRFPLIQQWWLLAQGLST